MVEVFDQALALGSQLSALSHGSRPLSLGSALSSQLSALGLSSRLSALALDSRLLALALDSRLLASALRSPLSAFNSRLSASDLGSQPLGSPLSARESRLSASAEHDGERTLPATESPSKKAISLCPEISSVITIGQPFLFYPPSLVLKGKIVDTLALKEARKITNSGSHKEEEEVWTKRSLRGCVRGLHILVLLEQQGGNR